MSRSQFKLDNDQTKAVYSNNSKICVVAGAGSGKTRCLIERVKRLLDAGEDPSGMICITFTNMAAQEMKQRLSEYDTSGMYIGTIHGYAYKLLMRNKIKYNILSSQEEERIAKMLIDKYAKHLTVDKFNEWSRKRALKNKGYITNYEMMSILNAEETEELKAIVDTVRKYDYEISESSDLDEIAKKVLSNEYSVSLSEKYPQTVTSVAMDRGLLTFNKMLDICTSQAPSNVKYLFVDEFQDVGVFEYRFIAGLNAKNIFVVGDDFQSIYKFKGADFTFFKALINSPEYQTIMLTNNYRSKPRLVDETNSIISNITDVIPKTCKSMRNRGSASKIIHEKGGVPTVMRYLSKIDKRDYGKWFVLTRSNSDSVHVSRCCYHEGIPTITFKKGSMTVQEVEAAMSENTVKILTIHAAKGLENNNVLLYGEFPTPQEIDGYYSIANSEECRIYYVGATRAKDNLVVVHKPKFEKAN